MKIRTGFVSNSSSSSFVVAGYDIGSDKDIDYLDLYMKLTGDTLEEVKSAMLKTNYYKDKTEDPEEVRSYVVGYLLNNMDFDVYMGSDDGVGNRCIIGITIAGGDECGYLDDGSCSFNEIIKELEPIKKALSPDSEIRIYTDIWRFWAKVKYTICDSHKEAISQKTKGEGKFVRQTGGRGQYGHVIIEIEPLFDDDGHYSRENVFENKIVGGAIPKEYVPAIERGVKEGLASGPLSGYPIVGAKVTLIDGSFHAVDSSEISFEQAGVLAVRDILSKAGPVLLGPD